MRSRQVGGGICRHQRTGDREDSGYSDTLPVSGVGGTPSARREPAEHDTSRIDAILAVMRFDEMYGLRHVVDGGLHGTSHIARLDWWQTHLRAQDTDARHRHLVRPRKNRFAARLWVHLREP